MKLKPKRLFWIFVTKEKKYLFFLFRKTIIFLNLNKKCQLNKDCIEKKIKVLFNFAVKLPVFLINELNFSVTYDNVTCS